MTARSSTLGTLWRLTGLHWAALIIPTLAGSLTLVSALALTIVSGWLITRAWQMPPVMTLTVAVTAVRALGISRSVFRYIDRLLSHQLALTAAANARTNLWQRIASADSAAVSGMTRGSMLTRLGDDVDNLADVIVRSLLPMCIAAFTSACAVAFTALLSPVAAAIVAAGLLVSGVVAPWLIYRGVQRAEAARGRVNRSHADAISRVLYDAAALRVRGTLDSALADTHATTLALSQADRRAAPFQAAGQAVSMLGYLASAIATVVAVVWLFTDASGNVLHSPEWLTVLVLIPLAAFESTMALPAAASALSKADDAASRLGHTSALPSRAPGPGTTLERPHLVVRDLVTGYDVDLQRWHFELPFGNRKEIIAPSGSGKTTLLKTLAGLTPARSGNIVLFDGNSPVADSKEIGDSPATELRFIAEDEHIFATSVRDNLAVGNPSATDGQMLEVLAELGLDEWVAQLPDGLSTMLSAGDESLSGGQRRRLIVARALLSTAPIVLFDEPTEHVDKQAEHLTELLLHRDTLPGVRPERTVIVVRHPRHT